MPLDYRSYYNKYNIPNIKVNFDLPPHFISIRDVIIVDHPVFIFSIEGKKVDIDFFYNCRANLKKSQYSKAITKISSFSKNEILSDSIFAFITKEPKTFGNNIKGLLLKYNNMEPCTGTESSYSVTSSPILNLRGGSGYASNMELDISFNSINSDLSINS